MTAGLIPAVTWNGDTHQPAQFEELVGYERPLQSLNAGDNFAYCLWHHPADEEFTHPDSLTDYLQCAGTAERMTVELRETRNGQHTHWTLGRAPVHRRAHGGDLLGPRLHHRPSRGNLDR